MRGDRISAVLLCALSATASAAQFDAAWQTETSEGVVIKSREVAPGTIEVVAEGTIEATVQDVEDVLRRGELHSRFMPYVKESRVLRSRGAVTQTYKLLQFAFVLEPRDVITESTVLQSSKTTNTFQLVWKALPDAVPTKEGVLRVEVNEGEWLAKGLGAKTQVSYRFKVSPGGVLPGFAQQFARREGVLKVFNAIEQEANDRAFRRRTYSRIKSARTAGRR